MLIRVIARVLQVMQLFVFAFCEGYVVLTNVHSSITTRMMYRYLVVEYGRPDQLAIANWQV